VKKVNTLKEIKEKIFGSSVDIDVPKGNIAKKEEIKKLVKAINQTKEVVGKLEDLFAAFKNTLKVVSDKTLEEEEKKKASRSFLLDNLGLLEIIRDFSQPVKVYNNDVLRDPLETILELEAIFLVLVRSW